MQKQIVLGGRGVNYLLKISKRARRMRLSIYPDGRFVVSVPRRVDEISAEKFIRTKASWILLRLKYFEKHGGSFVLRGSKKDFEAYKIKALEFVQERIEYFSQIYGFKFSRISIKNQATRWGSCSKKGNLNFNYKIVLISRRLADYIIFHELCHLKEFNHSIRFWQLVAREFPDFQEIRQSLRRGDLGGHVVD